VFLPMFTLGLRGINRRLFDAGLQYSNGAAVGPINEHITLAAFAVGLAQIPLLVNLALSLWRGAPADENPWEATTLEWQTGSPPPHGNFASPPTVHRGAYNYSVPGAERDFISQADPA
jgi:cytochrome c oxidase subunit 1